MNNPLTASPWKQAGLDVIIAHWMSRGFPAWETGSCMVSESGYIFDVY